MSTYSLVEGTANFRDIAASPGPGASRLRPGVFYRSDALGSVSERGLEQFRSLGVSTVVDLRALEEATLAPDLVPDGLEAVSVPLLQGRQDTPTGLDLTRLPALTHLYASMLKNNAGDLVRIVQTVAHTPGATLVHCTAGKDRTGLSTALMLSAIGVDPETIVADYALTESRLSGAWEQAHLQRMAAHGIEVTDDLRRLLVASPPEAMEATLQVLDSGYGGGYAYLRDAGMADAELTRLADKLLL